MVSDYRSVFEVDIQIKQTPEPKTILEGLWVGPKLLSYGSNKQPSNAIPIQLAA
jgi:hypothetical protein